VVQLLRHQGPMRLRGLLSPLPFSWSRQPSRLLCSPSITSEDRLLSLASCYIRHLVTL
jgi:hypothetical protein